MIIKVETKDEHLLINQLCDIALKSSGIDAIKGVDLVLSSVEVGYELGKTTGNLGDEKKETEKPESGVKSYD